MNFNIFKRKWLRNEFEKMDQRDRQPVTAWPQSVLIIIDTKKDQDTTIFKHWCDFLAIKQERCTIIGRCKNVKNSLLTDLTLFDTKFMNWNGGVSDDNLSSLLDMPYDLQLNYYDLEDSLMHYIARRGNAAFKVGFSHHDEATYDMAINIPTNEEKLFITEVDKFLKIILK